MPAASPPSLRTVFAGRRGRLLVALLLAEFAAALQGIAYGTVLPLAARDLDGRQLYGATLAAGPLVTVLVLALGVTSRLRPRTALALATALYVAGVALSAAAPAMPLLLAGSAVRGVAGGLLGALGFSAIGGLFEDAVRHRVLGLFAVVWVLPSLAGPPVNAAIAVAAGWRWAMAWPAVLVVLARLLVGRHADLVPAATDRRPVAPTAGLVTVGGLLLASAASGSGAWGAPLLAAGLLVGAVAGSRVLAAAAGGRRSRVTTMLAFAALVVAFFGGDGAVPLAVVEGLHRGVVASAVAVGAGLVTWALTGLRPPAAGRRPDAGTAGAAVLAAALVAEAVLQVVDLPRTGALVVAVLAWAAGGAGTGLAYGRLSAEAFDDLAPERVPTVAAGVAFAETASAVVGSLLGGGVYSAATTLGVGARPALATGLLLVAVVAAAGALVAARRKPPRPLR